MPEIKHQFTGGKMNKDVDERLVPNGEYRDAMNIQVATSEESEVGTVQNILGNKEINSYVIPELKEHCIATIADESNDVGYYFIASSNTSTEWDSTLVACEVEEQGGIESNYNLKRDMIVKFDGVSTTPIFVDPYLKTCFATCDTVWDVDLFNTVNNNPASPINTGIKFDTMCQGNPHSIERNDIITKIETVNGIFSDLHIRISNFPSNSEFHLSLADIPLDVRGSIANSGINNPIRFTIGGENHRVLNFDKDKLITGINIIDDMLFWTDNYSEPKKININRSMQGTSDNYYQSTKLIVNSENAHYSPNTIYGNWHTDAVACKEEHITVIKKSPNTVLWVESQDATQLTTGYIGAPEDIPYVNASNPGATANDYLSFGFKMPNNQDPSVGDLYDFFLVINPGLSLVADDIIVFNSVSLGMPSKDSFQCKVVLNSFNSVQKTWEVEILSIDQGFDVGDNYNWTEIFKPDQDAYKEKFPRFSYRYKYEDGEYSCFAPFTNPIFTPGVFSYEPKKAYNLGMQNTIRKVAIKGYKNNIPLDAVQVDILYKESNSPLVYLIDSIKPNPNPFDPTPNSSTFWEDNGSYTFNIPFSTAKGYIVTPNMNKGVLPSSQLLRSWDNVPRLALAQEITANRIVYANYLQNYNISSIPSLKVELKSLSASLSSKKSLKSIRNYSLGISYLDKFNRQSPVFASEQSEVKIPLSKSKNLNKIKVTPLTVAPDWATHCKVFVKDTSNEYYNLAMDRIYDAEDDNIWISFPSSDRNKITDESFLILKKDHDGDTAVEEKNRYKILAIESEAPEFIKTKVKLIAESSGNVSVLFSDPLRLPAENVKKFRIDYNYWNSVEMPFSDIDEDISLRFSAQPLSGTAIYSSHYDVISVHDNEVTGTTPSAATYYDLLLDTKIKEAWLAPAGSLDPTLGIKIYRKILENKPEFDGRFFVKIEKDPLIETNVIAPITSQENLEEILGTVLPFRFLADGGSNHPENTGNAKTHNEAQWDTIIDEFPNDESGWFIDATHYKGFYDSFELNHMGMLYLEAWPNHGSAIGLVQQTQLNQFANDNYVGRTRESVYVEETGNPAVSPDDHNKDDWTAFNKGIYTTGGKHYIDLAFSGIGKELHNPNFEAWRWANHAGLTTWDTFAGGGFIPGESLNGHHGYQIAFNPNHSFYGEDPLGTGYVPYTIGGGTVNDPPGSNFINGLGSDFEADELDLYGRVSNRKNDPAGEHNHLNSWRVGSNYNTINLDQKDIVQELVFGGKFKFTSFPQNDVIYTITNNPTPKYYVNHTNSKEIQESWEDWGQEMVTDQYDGLKFDAALSFAGCEWFAGFDIVTGPAWSGSPVLSVLTDSNSNGSNVLNSTVSTKIEAMGKPSNRRVVYTIEIDKNPLTQVFNPINTTDGANFDDLGEMQFLTYEVTGSELGGLQSTNPAIWETEQNADNDLDIYYEVDDVFPLEINSDTNYDFAPIGTTFIYAHTEYTILEWADNRCRLDKKFLWNISLYSNNPISGIDITLEFNRPNDSIVTGKFLGLASPIGEDTFTFWQQTVTLPASQWIIIDRDVSQNPITLSWYNCYSFGNGVESDRIRDDFNQVKIDKGAKASSTLEEYKEERRKTGLIYSGLYNSNSGLNNLNQFIQAEKITKDINPTYGSIQKLHARDTDLVTLCEDKCLRILANKDAVFNADGNPQLTATANVLGQTIPFSGEFGISKNPESFASESYRVYFTDRTRGTVMRLSKDGLTPISMYGMKDWFKDNLKLSNRIIGSYDDKKDEYNVTLKQSHNAAIKAEVESKPYYDSGPLSDGWASAIDDDGGTVGL